MGGAPRWRPFVRIGEGAFVAAGAMVETDVPPFVIAAGDRARVRALNRVGLRRRGVPEASRSALGHAPFACSSVDAAPRSESLRATRATSCGDDPYVRRLVGFLERDRAGPLARRRRKKRGTQDALLCPAADTPRRTPRRTRPKRPTAWAIDGRCALLRPATLRMRTATAPRGSLNVGARWATLRK